MWLSVLFCLVYCVHPVPGTGQKSLVKPNLTAPCHALIVLANQYTNTLITSQQRIYHDQQKIGDQKCGLCAVFEEVEQAGGGKEEAEEKGHDQRL